MEKRLDVDLECAKTGGLRKGGEPKRRSPPGRSSKLTYWIRLGDGDRSEGAGNTEW
jgi:hypothetical protein